MNDERFQATATKGIAALRAALSPTLRIGTLIAYNAYYHGQEVVCLGWDRTTRGHTLTTPLAILIDDQVFAALRVDDESGRIDGTGRQLPPQVI